MRALLAGQMIDQWRDHAMPTARRWIFWNATSRRKEPAGHIHVVTIERKTPEISGTPSWIARAKRFQLIKVWRKADNFFCGFIQRDKAGSLKAP